MGTKTKVYLRLPNTAKRNPSQREIKELCDTLILLPSGDIGYRKEIGVLPPAHPESEERTLEEVVSHHHFDFLTLGSEIGRGGLAVVYRMETTHNQSFALKVPLKITEQTGKHFALEAKLLRDLSRANVAVPTPISHGVARDFPYVLMDDLGPDFLTYSVLQTAQLAASRTAKALRVGISVCDALTILHEYGYVHNDIKPRNIHYSYSGAVHLLDFASASLRDACVNSLIFSPLYLAPERVTSELSVNEKVDIFGLGLVFYELLAGKPAFWHVRNQGTVSGIREHVHCVRSKNYPTLSGYPLQLTRLIASMMEYDPARRPELPFIREKLGDFQKEYFG